MNAYAVRRHSHDREQQSKESYSGGKEQHVGSGKESRQQSRRVKIDE